MGLLTNVVAKLRRIGILPAFSDNEVMDAYTEDKLREHNDAVSQIRSATATRYKKNDQLREQLRRVKSSAALAEFERAIRKEHH